MHELKVSILYHATKLLELLEHCDNDEFIDEIVNAVYCNDVAPLWKLEDDLREDDIEE
jgi:hypothetical protein